MARYNRDYLVPYLQNVCALHLANRKLERRIADLDWRIRGLQNEKNNPMPTRRAKEPVITFGRIAAILFGAFLILGAICGLTLETNLPGWSTLLIAVFGFVFGGTVILWAIQFMNDARLENQEDLRKYQAKVDIYNRTIHSNNQARLQIPALQAEMEKCTREQNRVNGMLTQMYSANIIPRQYRHIYAAVYLHDWFSTSRADDLDMALNMFVLEEIKEKLDIIIANQSEMILNQCLMIANQQKSFEQQQRHHSLMRAKLDQIAASNEERNTYLSMIESNTAATAYFAAANYIRSI